MPAFQACCLLRSSDSPERRINFPVACRDFSDQRFRCALGMLTGIGPPMRPKLGHPRNAQLANQFLLHTKIWTSASEKSASPAPLSFPSYTLLPASKFLLFPAHQEKCSSQAQRLSSRNRIGRYQIYPAYLPFLVCFVLHQARFQLRDLHSISIWALTEQPLSEQKLQSSKVDPPIMDYQGGGGQSRGCFNCKFSSFRILDSSPHVNSPGPYHGLERGTDGKPLLEPS